MNILIVGPSWVGDMVMAQTLFQCLKQRHPECEIDVLAPEWSRPILERMPEVRKALSFPLGHGALELATRRKIGKSLKGQYDQAILLPNSLKSALVPFFAGIPKRTGWRGEFRYGLLNDVRKLDKQRYPLMIERFMALAYAPGADLPKPYRAPICRLTRKAEPAPWPSLAWSWTVRCWRCARVPNSASPSAGRPSTTPKSPSKRSVKAGKCGCLARKTITGWAKRSARG